MLIKAGVDISRLLPPIRKKLNEIEDILKYFDNEMIITSTFEGCHCAGSLHYAHLAIDIRLPDNNRENVVNDIKLCTGSDYDVCVECDHLHIEYDPK